MKVHIQKFFGDTYTPIHVAPPATRTQGVFFPGDLVQPKSWRRFTDLPLSSPDGERKLYMRPGEVGVVLEAPTEKLVRLLTSAGLGDCYADDLDLSSG